MHLSFYVQIALIMQFIITMKIILYGGLLNLFAMLVMVNGTDYIKFCTFPSFLMGYCRT